MNAPDPFETPTSFDLMIQDVSESLTPEQDEILLRELGLRPGQIELHEGDLQFPLIYMMRNNYISYNDVALLRELLSRQEPFPTGAIDIIDEYIRDSPYTVNVDPTRKLSRLNRLINDKLRPGIFLTYIVPYQYLIHLLLGELTIAEYKDLANELNVDISDISLNSRLLTNRWRVFTILSEEGYFNKDDVENLAIALENIGLTFAAGIVRQYQEETGQL